LLFVGAALQRTSTAWPGLGYTAGTHSILLLLLRRHVDEPSSTAPRSSACLRCRSGRLGQPRAQQDTDPLGRPLRGRDYGDDYTVKVPGEIDVQRARRIIEELRRRFGDVLRPQEELDYIERLLKDY
jgi:hypothetical protein